jgi:hypothetical protein
VIDLFQLVAGERLGDLPVEAPTKYELNLSEPDRDIARWVLI